jgi:hypothetical protein
MRSTQIVRAATALALATMLAACSDSPTAAGTEDAESLATLDMAAVAGDQIAADVGMVVLNEGAFGLPTVPLARFGSWNNDCAFDRLLRKFACQVRHIGSFDVSRSFEFFDALGAVQDAFDPATTASAHFESTVTGEANRNGFSASFTRKRNLTVSGLEGAETTHIVNGTTTADAARSQHTDGGRSRSYVLQGSGAIVDLVIPVPRSADGWPLSGTITRDLSFERENSAGKNRSGSRKAEVTFNGTQFVPMTVNGRSFTLDLATGRPVPVE